MKSPLFINHESVHRARSAGYIGLLEALDRRSDCSFVCPNDLKGREGTFLSFGEIQTEGDTYPDLGPGLRRLLFLPVGQWGGAAGRLCRKTGVESIFYGTPIEMTSELPKLADLLYFDEIGQFLPTDSCRLEAYSVPSIAKVKQVVIVLPETGTEEQGIPTVMYGTEGFGGVALSDFVEVAKLYCTQNNIGLDVVRSLPSANELNGETFVLLEFPFVRDWESLAVAKSDRGCYLCFWVKKVSPFAEMMNVLGGHSFATGRTLREAYNSFVLAIENKEDKAERIDWRSILSVEGLSATINYKSIFANPKQSSLLLQRLKNQNKFFKRPEAFLGYLASKALSKDFFFYLLINPDERQKYSVAFWSLASDMEQFANQARIYGNIMWYYWACLSLLVGREQGVLEILEKNIEPKDSWALYGSEIAVAAGILGKLSVANSIWAVLEQDLSNFSASKFWRSVRAGEALPRVSMQSIPRRNRLPLFAALKGRGVDPELSFSPDFDGELLTAVQNEILKLY